MKKIFRKISVLLIMLIIGFGLASCDKKQQPEPEPEKVKVVVTFDSLGGSDVSSIEVNKDETINKPADPTKEGFNFVYWYLDDEKTSFNFNTPITGNITLKAYWTEVALSTLEKIEADYQAVLESFIINDELVNTVSNAPVYNSRVIWFSKTPYVSVGGIVLPLLPEVEPFNGELEATFKLDGESVKYTFSVPLNYKTPTTIATSQVLTFENLTTEYDVEDSELELFFEEEGTVPYVNVESFFGLLSGFIDPATDITFTYEAGVLTIFYQYYDEDEDHTYDLTCVIDSVNQTITTPDPGFYWAYVYSTETNYGRHIEYLRDHVDESSVDGTDLVYNLKEYNLEIVNYNNQILLPFSLANQLFAGSGYYNVYYNGDGLYGIYSLPKDDTDEYTTIKTSSLNDTRMASDLVIHNFNTLAFYLNNFYGLKDHFEIDTFYDFLFRDSTAFLSTSPLVVDNALATLLLKKIDEPHTSYGYPSYYNKIDWEGPSTNSLSNYGPRFNSWYMDGFVAVDDVIEAKWGRHPGMSTRAWAAGSENRPDYWFLDDTHAVLILDGFSTEDIHESALYDKTTVDYIMKTTETLLPDITEGNKFFYYNTSSKTNRQMEVIVKGVSEGYIDTYEAALITFGYQKHFEEAATGNKFRGYFSKVIGEKTYMVQSRYDQTYGVLYVGIYDEAPEAFSDEWPFYVNVTDLIEGDTAVFLEFTLEKLFKEKPLVKDIILDLTWNTGGNIGALYRTIGFITDKPFKTTSIDGGTGSKSTSYIQISGVPSYSHIRWSLLTSPLTFSAANSLATIFKENNLGIIIGMKTGGGACSITPVLLPNGSAFTMSSNRLNGFRTGSGTEADPFVYHNNEDGITPDYVITYSQFYDETKLLEVLNTHYNG
ncbi:MAG: InlB B-repeat-containing protein [Acholeplasmatales bacterium]